MKEVLASMFCLECMGLGWSAWRRISRLPVRRKEGRKERVGQAMNCYDGLDSIKKATLCVVRERIP